MLQIERTFQRHILKVFLQSESVAVVLVTMSGIVEVTLVTMGEIVEVAFVAIGE